MTMNKIDFDRCGGANVHFRKTQHKTTRLIFLLLVAFFLYSSSAFAQGSIFGAVRNSDATVPASGEITFFGFMENTDEELRIETSDGAGYDAGNWYDDFQNYLSKAPGNPYDFYFYNIANGEGSILAKTIPSNSFQQEDVTLAPVSWPAKPAGLAGQAVSGSSAVISWTQVTGMTYHVYRRAATSNGSFFRRDDPAGSLANHGVAGNYFIDNGVDGVSSYHYMVIAEDALGNFSPHSDFITVDAAAIASPVVNSITPNSGSYVGGTSVSIQGTGFDMAGVTAHIGVGSLTSVVIVSPSEIVGLTPPGTVGAADVTVTNTAAALISAPLVGGFNYLPNSAPIITPIGPHAVAEGANLNFVITASDPDGSTPVLFTSVLPSTATFVDNGDGTGTFNWTPTFTEAGIYPVTFHATDNIDTSLELVQITVNDAGNQPPVLAIIGPKTVAEGANLNFNITAADSDGTIPSLSALNLPTNATFVDNTNGTGTFNFDPDLTQAGIYDVIFKAFDGVAVDSEVVSITVTNTNQAPLLAAIGAQATAETVNLNFAVSATDADNDPLTLTTSALPGTATFLDNLDGTGIFDWTPGYTDAGVYNVTFYVSDGQVTDSEQVSITVNDAGNQAPVLAAIGPLSIGEGGHLVTNITASDPDNTTPQLFAGTLPPNAAFVDSGNGVGTFTFDPDYTQAGLFDLLFYASDGLLADSETVQVTVLELGNQPPVINPINDTLIDEGDSLVIVMHSSDPDGDEINLSASSTVPQFDFVDSGNGVGVFRFAASYFDAGIDSIWFSAIDTYIPSGVATEAVRLTITDINQPPVMDSIGPFGVAVDDTLTFIVTASDSTDPVSTNRLLLAAIGLPSHASFRDNGDNTGTFTFVPDSTQVGIHTATFVATDIGTPQLADQMQVSMTVVKENRMPVVTVGQAFAVWEGATLAIPFSATDPDGTIPVLSVTRMPENSSYIDNHDGTGLFTFNPSYTQSGLFAITVRAYDGFVYAKSNVMIQVYEAGNQAPVITPLPVQNVTEGDTLTFTVEATDPDATIPVLTADSLPLHATFTDNLDGTGTINFYPSYIQNGTYRIYIVATDTQLIDTQIVTIIVAEAGPQPPILAPVANQTVDEMKTLTFNVSATDPDFTIPYLSAANLPPRATFVDNRDYTGTFRWVTNNFDSGSYAVNIIAADSLDVSLTDTVVVNITVNDVNQPPRINTQFTDASVNEGDTLHMLVYVLDADSTIPLIRIHPDYPLGTNMSFVDSLNGKGLFTFAPNYTQGGSTFIDYYTRFIARDVEDTTLVVPSDVVMITVNNANQPPLVNVIQGGVMTHADTLDFAVAEGDSLKFEILGTDSDGTQPVVSSGTLPPNATFTGPFYFRKAFAFRPDFSQDGLVFVTFKATDGLLWDSLVARINVADAGNQTPAFTMSLPASQTAVANNNLINHLTASDPDLDILTIAADPIIENAIFVDSGNGSAVYRFSPAITQVGLSYTVRFTVMDPFGAADTIITQYNVILTLRGDANTDDNLNLLDVMYLVNYLYKGGPAPVAQEAADVNFDGSVNILDVSYMVNYLYRQGPPPPGN